MIIPMPPITLRRGRFSIDSLLHFVSILFFCIVHILIRVMSGLRYFI